MDFEQLLPLPIAEPWPLVVPGPTGFYEVAAELPATLGSIVRIQDKHRATVISEKHDRIDLFEWVVGSLSQSASLQLPEDMYATDVALVGDVLFVSGGYRWPTTSEEILLTRSLQGDEWTAVDLPKQCRRPGKLIDALLIDGKRMIAVDNAVKPKWFLEYNVEKPERPALLGTPELKHEPSEHALSAILGSRFVAVRSVAVTNDGFSRFVRLYDRHSLLECAYATASHGGAPGSYREVSDPAPGRDQLESHHQWHDIAFLKDTLLIAGGRDGLGILDTKKIRTLERKGTSRPPPPAFIGEDDLRFVPPSPRQEVLGVVPVTHLNGCYIIEGSAGGRSARWWPLD
jgi:hypothetical protein